MKVSRPAFSQKASWPFCCLLLATFIPSRSQVLTTFNVISERNSANFMETLHYYLRTKQILQTDFVFDTMQCALNCLVTKQCSAFNFALKANLQGQHLCELLASDKFNNYLEPNGEFHHYRFLNPCEYGVCRHGSTCHPLYESHGFLCQCASGYTGKYCDSKVPVWLKMNTHEVCFGARDTSYGSFTMQYSGNIASLKLVHIRGQISCRTDDNRYSNWACNVGDILQTFVTNANNALILPQLSGISNYQIPGIRSDSPVLTFNNLSVPLTVAAGEEFRVWYKEDLKDWSEADNGGMTCMDIYALYV